MTTTLVLSTLLEPDVRIGLDRPLGAELQRICLEQFDRAIDGLAHHPDPDAGVHEARKAMKRLRALLRLVRDELGFFAYRQENVVLRDVARRIAAVRDTRVLVATLRGMGVDFPDVDPGAFDRPLAGLEDDHRRATELTLEDRQSMASLLTTLRCSRRRFAAWPLDGAHPDGGDVIRDSFAAVAGGIRRVYQRGRRAYAAAAERPEESRLHEWRKRVKYLRYQMEALQPIHPASLDDLAADLTALGEQLGTEHDFAVLEALLAERLDLTGGEGRRRLLLALTGRRRSELQRSALALGSRLYAEDPDTFVGRIEALWEAVRPRDA